MRAVKEDAASREAALQAELQATKASLATHLEKLARARRAHERCALTPCPQALVGNDVFNSPAHRRVACFNRTRRPVACRELRAQTARADESAAALEAAHQHHAAEVAALRAEVQVAQANAAEELRRQRRALVSAPTLEPMQQLYLC